MTLYDLAVTVSLWVCVVTTGVVALRAIAGERRKRRERRQEAIARSNHPALRALR